jgi:hypothetical protein
VYKTYLPSCYLFSYLSIYIFETYFLPNWLPRWKHIQTQLKFIHNWVITGILQWMVWSWVLVHCGQHVRYKSHCIWSIFYRPRYEAEVSFRPKGNFFKTAPLFFFFWPPQYQPLFVFIPAWALNCLKNVMLLAGDLPPRHGWWITHGEIFNRVEILALSPMQNGTKLLLHFLSHVCPVSR